jgi:hypothetical protein
VEFQITLNKTKGSADTPASLKEQEMSTLIKNMEDRHGESKQFPTYPSNLSLACLILPLRPAVLKQKQHFPLILYFIFKTAIERLQIRINKIVLYFIYLHFSLLLLSFFFFLSINFLMKICTFIIQYFNKNKVSTYFIYFLGGLMHK